MNFDIPLIVAALALVGGGLIFLEFFVPGGILGVLGVIALAVMTVMVFVNYGAMWGGAALLGSVLVGVIYLALFLAFYKQTPIGRLMTLKSEVQGQSVPELARETWVGKRGESMTPLRPVGKALIGGQRMEVQAESGLIPSGTPVEVVRVSGSRLMVRAVQEEAPVPAV